MPAVSPYLSGKNAPGPCSRPSSRRFSAPAALWWRIRADTLPFTAYGFIIQVLESLSTLKIDCTALFSSQAGISSALFKTLDRRTTERMLRSGSDCVSWLLLLLYCRSIHAFLPYYLSTRRHIRKKNTKPWKNFLFTWYRCHHSFADCIFCIIRVICSETVCTSSSVRSNSALWPLISQCLWL